MNSSIKEKIKTFNAFPKKKLGQHFLINPQTIQKIVLSVKNLKPTKIIEIGPGWGALTKPLIDLKRPLQVVETDTTLAQYWRSKNISVLETSALKINWLAKGKIDIKNGTVLVGNLPFNIGSRLLVQLCPGPSFLKAMVFMFQKEVAQRILSPHKCKNYGILSVLSQCFWDTKLLLSAGRADFYPRPKVVGQVLIFKPKKHKILDPKGFLFFIKFCFAQRRKTLFTRLCKFYLNQPGMEQQLLNIFDKMNIDRLSRAEELSPSQFKTLFHFLGGGFFDEGFSRAKAGPFKG